MPIIYLPGVSRATLRATEDCPHELKPLAELQYRGVIWSQANAKDWTIAAYLQTEKGGLQPDDRQGSGHGDLPAPGRRKTGRCAARRPASQVRGRGTQQQLLRLAGERRSGGRPALVDVAPEGDAQANGSPAAGKRCAAGASPTTASTRFATASSSVPRSWASSPRQSGRRPGSDYAAAPARYPGLEALLRKAKPPPKRHRCSSTPTNSGPRTTRPRKPSCEKNCSSWRRCRSPRLGQTLTGLEQKHGARREWVWARLNQSPLACAIQHLATLANVTATPLTGATLADMVKAYTDGGWKADAAVLDALAAVSKPADQEAVNDRRRPCLQALAA